MLDMIIVGAGPAGITAAVYAARKRLEFIVISKDIGGQTAWSGEIENYTGYQFISGPELVRKFEEHMKANNVALKEGDEVIEIARIGDVIRVKTNKEAYEARTVVIASGKRVRELGVPGEKEFKTLNETPLEKEVYLDTHVELEQDYEYAVTAVDNSVQKNESPLSEEVRVKYIY